MPSGNHREVRLTKFLKESCISLGIKATSKKDAIAELVDLVAKSGKIKNKKIFLSAVLKREKLGSTGIGNGVAMPHAKSDAAKDFMIAFGRSEQGIDFGALDGEKTYLFFLLASPEKEVGLHLKMLAKISHVVKDKFVIENLQKAASGKEILRIINLYSR